MPPNDHSDLAARLPMPGEPNWERMDDIDWARNDPEVAERYAGQWVVPYQKTIIAAGTDAGAVLQEALAKTGLKDGDLYVAAMPHPDDMLYNL